MPITAGGAVSEAAEGREAGEAVEQSGGGSRSGGGGGIGEGARESRDGGVPAHVRLVHLLTYADLC
jgi:hypothetical protein